MSQCELTKDTRLVFVRGVKVNLRSITLKHLLDEYFH